MLPIAGKVVSHLGEAHMYLADKAHNWGTFSKLRGEEGPLYAFGKAVSSFINVIQSWSWLITGITIVLVALAIAVGGQDGRKWAKNKIVWTVLGLFILLSAVSIIANISKIAGGGNEGFTTIVGG